MLILTGLFWFPASRNFTCFPHSNGGSVMDYVMFNNELFPFINHSSITPIPLVDHNPLSFVLQTKPCPPTFLNPTSSKPTLKHYPLYLIRRNMKTSHTTSAKFSLPIHCSNLPWSSMLVSLPPLGKQPFNHTPLHPIHFPFHKTQLLPYQSMV